MSDMPLEPPMKLRVRGAARADWDWRQRIPSVGELFTIAGEWYRVTQVMWAVTVEGVAGYDVGIVVQNAQKPDETGWVPK